MIIDFHAHIYPDELAEKTLLTIRERAGIKTYADGTLAGLKRSMARASVERAVICGVATRASQVKTINRWLVAVREPGIHPLAAMHPDAMPGLDEMLDLKSRGFKGFKVHADFQGFYVDEKRMFPFYEAAQAAEMLILFHSGVDRGLPDTVHATPERLSKVHRDFPGLKVVAAHMGGEDMYEETEQYLLGKDVYLDTSFVLRKMPQSVFRRFVQKHPIERFLYGSDTPWGSQDRDLDFLFSLSFLKDAAKEKIAGKNAAGLLDLQRVKGDEK